MAEVEQLQQELARIEGLVEEAAVDEDVSEWIRLAMRHDALPAPIRQAKTAPIRQEVERLEEELAELDEELRQAQEGPLPEDAPRTFGVTATMMRSRRIEGIAARSSSLSKELRQARRQLAETEAGGAGVP